MISCTCKYCNNLIAYEKRNNRFCSQSCSAIYNNSRRPPRSIESRAKTSQTLRNKFQNGLIVYKPLSQESIQKRKNAFENKKVKFTCPVCFDNLWLKPSELKNRKFCSGTCRNKINNQFISGSCSKGELLLFETLKNNFPGLTIENNNRKIIPGNRELDIYIPELNIAIEWNGIYHYKAVHSQEGLEKTQQNDLYKKNYCEQTGIKLIVIKDLSSSKKSNIENVNYIVNLIKGEYSSIGRVSDSKPEG